MAGGDSDNKSVKPFLLLPDTTTHYTKQTRRHHQAVLLSLPHKLMCVWTRHDVDGLEIMFGWTRNDVAALEIMWLD